MKRYPAFDPPEYVDWVADPQVMEEYRQRIDSESDRSAVIAALKPEEHLRLYSGMLRNRLYDIMLKRWVRQGVISKAWLGTGEEAVTVGAVRALQKGDVVGPMIRNSGAFHEMGMSLVDMLRNYLGTADSPTQGRDTHIGDLKLGIVSTISMVGSLVPVCAGIALSFKLRNTKAVALTWAGDGTTRTTDFHEGLICARDLRVPLIVVIQDNQIAMGTTQTAHSREPMEAVSTIYGVPGYTCDGNHVLDVYATTSVAAERCRVDEGPVIITAKTLRLGGHATHDEGESRNILPPELFEHWGRRDPIATYEAFLADASFRLSSEQSNREVLERVEAEVATEVDRAAEEALESRRNHSPDPNTQRPGVFAPVDE
jgi:TPP-dependent pyruvate/acetoin dehydrogenase alpha subunit